MQLTPLHSCQCTASTEATVHSHAAAALPAQPVGAGARGSNRAHRGRDYLATGPIPFLRVERAEGYARRGMGRHRMHTRPATHALPVGQCDLSVTSHAYLACSCLTHYRLWGGTNHMIDHITVDS